MEQSTSSSTYNEFTGNPIARDIQSDNIAEVEMPDAVNVSSITRTIEVKLEAIRDELRSMREKRLKEKRELIRMRKCYDKLEEKYIARDYSYFLRKRNALQAASKGYFGIPLFFSNILEMAYNSELFSSFKFQMNRLREFCHNMLNALK